MATIKIEGKHTDVTIIEKSVDEDGTPLYTFMCADGVWCPASEAIARGHYDTTDLRDVIEWASIHADVQDHGGHP